MASQMSVARHLMNNFSIALCTYNGARFLEQQLASYCVQNRLPDELIVCDDGSVDSTHEILANFEENSPFSVRVFQNETRLGTTQNFAKAISLCTGDLIALSDQDDVWHPDKLARAEAVFHEHPNVQIVFSDLQIVDEELRPLRYTMWERLGFSAPHLDALSHSAIDVLLRRSVVTGAAVVVRAGFREHFLPIPDGWVHDQWIALIAAATAEIAAVDECLVQYRQHGSNQIGGLKETWRDQISRAAKSTSSDYQFSVLAYRNLLHQLRNDPHSSESALRLIEEKVNHLDVRANLPKQRISRFFWIMREVLTLHYFRFGNGWKSALRDLAV
jgi:glycosyltransferase involved in cell wall biosynthesis